MPSLVLHIGDHIEVAFDDAVHLVVGLREPSTDWRINEMWLACDKHGWPWAQVTSVTKAKINCLGCIANESKVDW